MSILFVGDVHLSDTPPSRRDENYCNDIFKKLDEVKNIAKDKKVNTTIFAGDIFHHKNPRNVSHRLVNRLLQYFLDFPSKVLIVVGNHDITEGRLESLNKQPIQVLDSLPNVSLLKWDHVHLKGTDITAEVMSVPGVPNVTIDDYRIKCSKTCWSIVVAHQSIYPNKSTLIPVLRESPSIHDSSEVAEVLNADIVLYGHEHARHGVYKRLDTTFINLGSICRGTLSDEDLQKVPAVALLQFGSYENRDFLFHEIPLKNVRPSEECFLLSEHIAQLDYKKDIELAISSFKASKLTKFSVEEVIHDISIRDDVHDTVKDVSVKLLEGVR